MQRKFLLIGDSGAGKSTLVHRMIKGVYNERIRPTIGAAFHTYRPHFDKKYTIWDVSGADRFRSMLPLYTRSLNAILFVYDVTDPNGLERIMGWRRALKGLEVTPPMLLFGNKADLQDQNQNEICRQKAQVFANENQMIFCGSGAAMNDQSGLLNMLWDESSQLTRQPGSYGQIRAESFKKNKSLLELLKQFFRDLIDKVNKFFSPDADSRNAGGIPTSTLFSCFAPGKKDKGIKGGVRSAKNVAGKSTRTNGFNDHEDLEYSASDEERCYADDDHPAYMPQNKG